MPAIYRRAVKNQETKDKKQAKKKQDNSIKTVTRKETRETIKTRLDIKVRQNSKVQSDLDKAGAAKDPAVIDAKLKVDIVAEKPKLLEDAKMEVKMTKAENEKLSEAQRLESNVLKAKMAEAKKVKLAEEAKISTRIRKSLLVPTPRLMSLRRRRARTRSSRPFKRTRARPRRLVVASRPTSALSSLMKLRIAL
jgi:hypothetical protein